MTLILRALSVVFLAVVMAGLPKAAEAQPAFSKVFSPNTIGPGGTSTLTFTINNSGGGPTTDLAFIDIYPAAITNASPANASTTCSDGTLTAADGGSSISLSGARIAGGASCTVTVSVTSSAVGTHTNTSGDLTSSAGNSGTATDDLVVNADLPGFTKAFSPSTIARGARSTLTYTIDNTTGSTNLLDLNFTHNLPSGAVVASPANASTTCTSSTLSATTGGSTVVLSGDGTFGVAVASGATCFVTVDVTGNTVGSLVSQTGDLTGRRSNFTFFNAGPTSAQLQVTGGGALQITKAFLNDPVAPGGTAQLEFVIQNNDRNFEATNVAFTDDLNAMLAGAQNAGVSFANTCGGSRTGAGVFSFSGGTVPAEGSCSFSILVSIPGGAADGSYPNTTSNVTGTVNGAGVTGDPATDTLFVSGVIPQLSKSFTPASITAGTPTNMEFTITNPSATTALSDLTFTDNISAFISGAGATPPSGGFCGGGSIAFVSSSSGSDILTIQGANLAAGASCTFQVGISTPSNTPGGVYSNTTSAITGTANGGSVTGSAASASLTVNGGANLNFTKAFTGGPVNAGGTATLEFTITNTEGAPVTGLAFSDDLATMSLPAGAEFTGATANTCGGMATGGFPTAIFGYSGGSLGTGGSCTITLTLSVPAATATGDYTNTSSALTGDGGVGDDAAQATLSVLAADDQPVILSKQFIDGPYLPGQTGTLRFTIENPNASNEATGIFFTDNLGSALAGFAATSLPPTPCGAGSSITGTTFLIFTGGTVPAGGATCTFDVTVQIPASAANGSYNSATSNVVATVGGGARTGDPAAAVLEVESAQLEITKTFVDPVITAGALARMEITVTNPTSSVLSTASYTDDLNAMLPGTTAGGNGILGCSGGASLVGSGTSNLSVTITNLPAGESCTHRFFVQPPSGAATGSYTNTVDDLSGMIGGLAVSGPTATANLQVRAVDAPRFLKGFAGPVFAGGTTNLVFTIINSASSAALSDLGFTDDLNAMLSGAVATGSGTSTCGGSVSGTGLVTFSGGSVAAGASCTVTIPVQAPGGAAAGSYPNTSSELFSNGVALALPATANLTVAAPPAFSKAFSPATIADAGISTLTFTIDNSAAALTVTSLDFTDAFPAGVVVATPASASTTCSGGTLTAVAGSAVASYTGGSVAASASCTVQVDVTTTAPGTFNNVSGDLTSSAGNSGTASATLTATASADLSVTITDAPDPIFPTQNLTYTVEVSNAGPSTATGVTSSFTLPAGVTLVSTSGCTEDPNGVASCTLGDIADGGSASYSIVVSVDAATTGTLNASTTVSSPVADPVAGNDTGTAQTTVNPQADISITKTDGVTSIRVGDTLNYTIVASNAGPSTDPSVSVTDTFPSDLTCTYTSVTAGGATGNTAAGAGNLAETLSMPSGSSATYTASCTVAADATGTLSNTATATASVNDPDTSNNSATDSDTVVVIPDLGFAKAFTPTSVSQGLNSRMVITIDNSANLIAGNTLAFTDAFPAGMVVATPANLANSCGGTIAGGTPGDTNLDLSGGSVPASMTCTVEVDVRAIGDTSATNITSVLTSSLPQAAAASATLTINPAGAPGFDKGFAPTAVQQGETSTLTISLDNSANSIEAENMAFTDAFPTGLVVATPANLNNTCGGTLTGGAAGDTNLGLSDVTLAAGDSCAVSVDVQALANTDVTNTTSALTSSLPQAAAVSATLSITPAAAPAFSKSFAPDTVEQGETSVMQLTIDNATNAIEATDLAFSDTFPDGLVVADPADLSNSCGGTITGGAAGETSLALSGGTVIAGEGCAISVRVRALANAPVTNTTSVLSSSLPEAPAASATLTINGAQAPVFAKTFTPDTVNQGETSTMVISIDNMANAIEAADLAFTDTFPEGLIIATPANLTHDCGGTITGAEGEGALSLEAGTVAAGASCSVQVDVRALANAPVTNTTSALSSSLPEAAAASATLTIIPAAGPEFAKSFTPSSVLQGDISTLSFTINNTASAIEAADLSFSDSFPTGMIVASPASVANSCGGSLTATAGEASLSFSGGNVAEGASCQIDVNVQALNAGSLVNTSSDLSSSLGTSEAASATLTVTARPLNVAMSFAPSTIEQFSQSTVTYTLTNISNIAATGIILQDSLPAGVTFATPSQAATTCSGGTVTAADGSAQLAYTGGGLAADSSCTVTARVVSSIVGSYPNSTETVTSSLGTSAAAQATLTVEVATTGSLTIVQNTDTDGGYVFSSSTSALNFTILTSGGTGRAGPITLPAGQYDLRQATPDGVGNTSITCNDTDSTGQARERTLSVTIDALEAVTCTFTSISSRQKTVDTINRFLTKRADLILSSEPSNSRRINRLKRGAGGSTQLRFANGDLNSFLPFTAQVSTASESYSLSTSFLQMREAAASLALAHGDQRGLRHIPNYRWDAWFEAQYKKFDAGADSGHFAIAYFGADYLISDDLLIGAMVQIDDMEDSSSALNSSVEGTGWMVGPYMTARLAPNLYFDGRVAVGTSVNDIRPFNTYKDEFTTDRWMATAGLTGDFQRGNWSIQPGASLSYFEETQNSYVDSIGVFIPSQTVSLGQVKIGPTFTGQFQTKDGMNYSPYMSLDAIYNFGDTSGVTVTNVDNASTEGWRGRVQAGVDFNMQNGTSISLGGSYDGIGRDQLDIWGLSFELNIPIQKATAK